MPAHPARAEFDAYKDSYREEVEHAISFVGQDLDYFTEVKARELLHLVERRLGRPEQLTALDVGCGVGVTDGFLAHRFRVLHGVDVAEGAIERAALLNPSVHYRHYGGGVLPFDTSSVDLAFAICVLHHVAPVHWQGFVAELERVTRPGGLVVVFEHNPLNPLTRRVVSRCAFDTDAVLLRQGATARLLADAGLSIVERRYVLFLPAGGGRVAPLERALGRVPLGGQYYVAGRAADRV